MLTSLPKMDWHEEKTFEFNIFAFCSLLIKILNWNCCFLYRRWNYALRVISNNCPKYDCHFFNACWVEKVAISYSENLRWFLVTVVHFKASKMQALFNRRRHGIICLAVLSRVSSWAQIKASVLSLVSY